ncbi:MAG: hypothetical protein QNJ72_45690 [Pleurocapsa sp. MO_226.B13]|nr:hypothetical protein [Pleurocapsa sp. MO_226.B13]
MFQPEDNFNGDRNLESERNLDNIDANLSPQNVAQRKQQLEKIFIKLIAIGLALGAVLGIGAYYLINWLGLNKKPYEIEQEQREQQQQQQVMFEEITNFPSIPESSRI